MSKRAATAKNQSTNNQSTNNHHLSHEHIAIRAYEIYIGRGAEHGRDLEDWFQAERELAVKTNDSARRHSLPI
jgi:hypothetical protein